MLTYIIVVNDNGEFKTISQTEVEKLEKEQPFSYIEEIINQILDDREKENAD